MITRTIEEIERQRSRRFLTSLLIVMPLSMAMWTAIIWILRRIV